DPSEAIELIVAIVDASNLTRNLYLLSQLLEMGLPVVLVLNMIDLASIKGYTIYAEKLSDRLGIPVVPICANKRKGIEDVVTTIVEQLHARVYPSRSLPVFSEEIQHSLNRLRDWGIENDCERHRAEWLRVFFDEGGYIEKQLVKEQGPAILEMVQKERARHTGKSLASIEAQTRYSWVTQILRDCISRPARPPKTKSDTIDRYLTHRVAGTVIFVLVMAVVFQAIYTWASPLMDWIEGGIGFLGEKTGPLFPDGAMRSLVMDGIFGGVGGVLVFLPQIAILFFFIAILEDCGYLPRAAYLMDRVLSFCGLSGKSCIPLLSSFACAVPGIMATRTIENKRDRLVTIMVAPLMSCSARLPVYLILIAAFIPQTSLLGGWLNLQGLTLLGCYLVGVLVAIPIAWLFKRNIAKDDQSIFIMELPMYKVPSLRNAFYYVYEQCREFIVRAGTIIFCVSVLVWALAYFPRSATIMEKYEDQRSQLSEAAYMSLHPLLVQLDSNRYADAQGMSALVETMVLDPQVAPLLEPVEENLEAIPAPEGLLESIQAAYFDYEEQLSSITNKEDGELLRTSFLGRMGRLIEPVVLPLGWDWRIGMAVIASFPAREIVVATLGTILNVGAEADEESSSLRQALLEAKRDDGLPLFTIPIALSIMVFFALCCQCAATIAAMKRETHTWKWPVFAFSYMTGLAYVCAMLTYYVATWIGKGIV
ncbi:MAG: ferrous iron transport protein B, partial [bacterium]|nr:ferrous iron transport protein B [bacterium]